VAWYGEALVAEQRIGLAGPWGAGRAMRADIEHLTVEVDDARLHVARIGAGPPLLLIHGWPEFWYTWHPVMTRLADRFEVFAPDLRGFGDSDKPDRMFGPHDQAADLAALINELGIAPVGVVSHDIGATITQSLVRRSPELIAGLFFFNFMYPGIGSRFLAPEHVAKVWHTRFNQSPLAPRLVGASPDTVRMFVAHFLQEWSHQPEAFDQATIDAFVDNMAKPGNLEGGFMHYRAVAKQRETEAAGTDLPAPIDLPTRVRWTDSDPTLDIAWTDRLGEFFTDLDFAPFPGAGHFPHHENPDLAAREIGDFFGSRRLRRWQR
jgi:pimeloyl-ACP methyl ester carboxylesterase